MTQVEPEPADEIRTPGQLRDARLRLGLSEEQLADLFGVPASRVRRWESGTTRIDQTWARLLAWQVAGAEHERRMAESGLPACGELEALFARMSAPRADAEEVVRSIEAHREACATCRAREAYAATLPPLPPMPDLPLGRGFRAFNALADRIGRIPRWLRPAVWGALLVGAMVMLRVVPALLVEGPSLRLFGIAGMALLAGAWMGGVGGLAYHVVRPATRRLGRPGDYLTGIACVLAYLLAMMVPMAIAGDEMARSASGWVIMLVVSVPFGLIVGHYLREA